MPEESRLANAVQDAGFQDYPRGISVTALEFEHGARQKPAAESVFLHRDIVGSVPPGWRDDDPTRVAALNDRVRQRSEVHGYRVVLDDSARGDLTEFVDVAIRVIGKKVERRALDIAGSRVDPVTAAESQFLEDRLLAFDGRADLVASAVDLAKSGSSVCLTGESGAGKSAI